MSATDQSKSLVRETEASRILNLSVKTLRRWRWAGKGPRFIKLGSAVRYSMADLDAYVAAAARTSTLDGSAGLSTGEVA